MSSFAKSHGVPVVAAMTRSITISSCLLNPSRLCPSLAEYITTLSKSCAFDCAWLLPLCRWMLVQVPRSFPGSLFYWSLFRLHMQRLPRFSLSSFICCCVLCLSFPLLLMPRCTAPPGWHRLSSSSMQTKFHSGFSSSCPARVTFMFLIRFALQSS